jgi:hypothetical protein
MCPNHPLFHHIENHKIWEENMLDTKYDDLKDQREEEE